MAVSPTATWLTAIISSFDSIGHACASVALSVMSKPMVSGELIIAQAP